MADQTVTVERSDLLEALSLIEAAGSISAALNGQADTALTEFFTSRIWPLKDKMLGRASDENDAWMRDPDTVEIFARDSELTAEALDGLGESARYREHARQIRQEGTIDVKFPHSEELVA